MLDELMSENTLMWLLVGGLLMLIVLLSMFKSSAYLPPINKEAMFGEDSATMSEASGFPPQIKKTEATHPRAEFDELTKARNNIEVKSQILDLSKAKLDANASAEKAENQRRMNEFLKRNDPNQN